MTIDEAFSKSLIRGLMSVCEETGLSPESVSTWVKAQDGYIYAHEHKGSSRLFCRLPEPQTEDGIPNIFEDLE